MQPWLSCIISRDPPWTPPECHARARRYAEFCPFASSSDARGGEAPPWPQYLSHETACSDGFYCLYEISADRLGQAHQVRVEAVFDVHVAGALVAREDREGDELAAVFLGPGIGVVEQELA